MFLRAYSPREFDSAEEPFLRYIIIIRDALLPGYTLNNKALPWGRDISSLGSFPANVLESPAEGTKKPWRMVHQAFRVLFESKDVVCVVVYSHLLRQALRPW